MEVLFTFSNRFNFQFEHRYYVKINNIVICKDVVTFNIILCSHRLNHLDEKSISNSRCPGIYAAKIVAWMS